MSDTPRADAGLWLYEDELGQGFDVVDIDIARQLERELAASEARVKELEEAVAPFLSMRADSPDHGSVFTLALLHLVRVLRGEGGVDPLVAERERLARGRGEER